MRTLLAVFFMLLSPFALGQGSHVDLPKVESQVPQPLAGLTITVCLIGATGVPCSPSVTVYSNQALTTPIASLKTDGDGLFPFFISPGSYQWCASDPVQGRITAYCTPFTVAPAGGQPAIFPKINGWFYVDGTTYATIHAATTAACAAGGGTVVVPPGTYPENTVLSLANGTLCSQLHILFSGSGRPDVATCPSTVTTTITSGFLFDWTGTTDGWMSDFCIKNIGAGGGGALQYSSTQTSGAERFYLYGPFATFIQFKSSSTATSSTIWNSLKDFHCSGGQAAAVGVKFDSADATTKTINGNRLINDHCTGGTGGKALYFTNTNQAQVINDNWIECSECSATGGTAIQFDQGATASTLLFLPNAEGSNIGLQKATGNTVIVIGSAIQSNVTNLSDSQPSFTAFLGGARGALGGFNNMGLSPTGGYYTESIGVGWSRPPTTAVDGFVGINGGAGWCDAVAAVCWIKYNSGDIQTSKPFNMTEVAAPSGSAGQDFLWADSTAHRLKMNNNNAGAVQVVGSGVDINTSDQVTATHLASALPTNQGGTGQNSTATFPTSGVVTVTVGSGTASMTTGAIGSGACGATVTVGASGVLTTDAIAFSFNAAPAANPAELVISTWPTANNVNFQYCNPTAGSVTPAAATLNWRVTR